MKELSSNAAIERSGTGPLTKTCSHRPRARPPKPGARVLILSGFLAVLIHALSSPVHAEARVAGEPDAVELEADEASVEEALQALSESFDLHYRTSADLHSSISGSYTGSLRQVVARLLRNYNFTMETSPSGIIVAVYGSSGANVGNSTFTTPGAAAAPPPRVVSKRGRAERSSSPGKNAALRAHRPTVK